MYDRPKFKTQNYETPRNNIENLNDLVDGNDFFFFFANDFLDTTVKAQGIKEIIDKLDFSKIKNFCSERDDVKRISR